MQKLTRRSFLKAVGATAAVAAMGTAMTGCAKEEGTVVEEDAGVDLLPAKIGYWGGTCEAPIMIAEANGYFEECGVNAEVFQITSGTAELIANNDIDFFEATPNFLPSIYNGLQIKLVDNIHTGCIQGAARPDSGITSYKDLEGKKLACIPRATWRSCSFRHSWQKTASITRKPSGSPTLTAALPWRFRRLRRATSML